MPDLSSEDAQIICDLLRASKTDPEDWTYTERAAVTRLHGLRESEKKTSESDDPMDGAIERLMSNSRFRGYRDVPLALNEAFRNGRRSVGDQVFVEIDGLPAANHRGRWTAQRTGETDESNVYRLDDDVRAAALDNHTCSYPKTGEQAWVLIPDLRAPNRMEGDPHEKIEYWRATNFGPPYGPVQLRIDDPRGTPNDVAVGRFKASLRKFLGLN